MGRLVQQRTTALCLRQTLPSAVRAAISTSTSNPIETASIRAGAVQNVDFESTAIVTDFRLDQEPPTIALVTPSANDLARVEFRASDADSGIATVELEVRRQGDSSWSAVPVTG